MCDPKTKTNKQMKKKDRIGEGTFSDYMGLHEDRSKWGWEKFSKMGPLCFARVCTFTGVVRGRHAR